MHGSQSQQSLIPNDIHLFTVWMRLNVLTMSQCGGCDGGAKPRSGNIVSTQTDKIQTPVADSFKRHYSFL